MARRVEAAVQPGRRGVAGVVDRLCLCGERKCSGGCVEGLSEQLSRVELEAGERLMDTIDWSAAYSREAEARRRVEVALVGERARSASLERQLQEMRAAWLDAEGRAASGRAA